MMFRAKSNHPIAPTEWRTLGEHSLDVASAVRVLLASPVLRERCAAALGEPIDAAVVDTLSVLAFLHDLGKADARWQAYIRGTGAKRDHTAPFLVHLSTTPPLYEALRPALALVDDEEAMLLTVIAHHGAPITEEALHRYRGHPDETTDAAAITETRRLVERAFRLYPQTRPIVWMPIMVRTPGLASPLDGGALEEIGVPLRWWRDREPSEEATVRRDASGIATLTAGSLSMH